MRLVDESSSFLLPGTFESLRADLGVTYTQVSAAFVAIALGSIAGTGASVAADHCSRRAICALGAAGYAASLVIIGAAGSAAALLVGAFVLGVASTALVDAAEIALADVAGDDLARHLTTQNVWGAVGGLLGPGIVIATVALGGSWRVCFFVGAALVLVYGLWLVSGPLPPPHAGGEEGATVRGTISAVLRDPRVWLAGVVSLLLGPLDEPLIAFLIAHLEQARGISAAGATTIATIVIGGELLGYATLRRRPGRLVVDASLLAVATTAVVVAPGAVTASLGALLIGVFLGRVWIDLQARILTVRPGQTGTVKAVITVVETVGWSLPVAAGALADRFDVTAGLATYAVIAWTLAAACVVLHRLSRRASAQGTDDGGPRRVEPGRDATTVDR